MRAIYIIFLFTIAFFSACGDGKSIEGKTEINCIPLPKDLTKGEYAKYRFVTDNYQKDVSAKIDDIHDDAYIISFEDNGTKINNYKLFKECKDTVSLNQDQHLDNTKKENIKLNTEEEYIIWNTYFIDIGKFHNPDVKIYDILKSAEECSNECISVKAGNFEVEKCVITYDDNRTNIKKIISYMMLKTAKSRPFYGHIKDVVILNDDTNLTSELVEWNNL